MIPVSASPPECRPPSRRPPSPPPRGTPFSATDAAFAGLRVARRDPLALAALALVCLAVSLLLGAALAATVGPQLMAFQAQAAGGAKPDPTQSMALLGATAPFYGLALPISLAFYGVLLATVNRAVLRAPAGWKQVRLGTDELLQAAVVLVLGVILFVVYLLGVVGVVFVAVLAGLASKGVGLLVGVVSGIALLCGLIYLMVRLSLASPLALDRRKLDLKGAWALTRGRFWPLLGAYVLAWLIAVVIGVAVFVTFAALATAAAGVSAASTIMRPDMSSVAAYFSPVMLLWIVVSSGLNALLLAIMVGAPADAYRQLSGAVSTSGAPGTAVPLTAADRSTAFGTRV